MVVIQKAEIRDPSGFLGKIQFLVYRISSNRASSLLENKVSCFYLLPRGGEEQIIEVFTPMVHVRIRGRKCKNVIQVSYTARRIVGEANKSRVKTQYSSIQTPGSRPHRLLSKGVIQVLSLRSRRPGSTASRISCRPATMYYHVPLRPRNIQRE